MDITSDIVKKVAKNARLNLTDVEVKEFTPQLKEILSFFEKIQKVPATSVSIHSVLIENEWREDKEEPSLKQEDALKNVNFQSKGFIRGPKTL